MFRSTKKIGILAVGAGLACAVSYFFQKDLKAVQEVAQSTDKSLTDNTKTPDHSQSQLGFFKSPQDQIAITKGLESFFAKIDTDLNKVLNATQITKLKAALQKRINELDNQQELVEHLSKIKLSVSTVRPNRIRQLGDGYVSIVKPWVPSYALAITFYSQHTYTDHHLQQAANNLITAVMAQLNHNVPDLHAKATRPGAIR